MVFAIVLVVWDLLILGWLVGNFTALVVVERSPVEELRDDLETTARFTVRRKVPPQLRRQMMEHAKLRHETMSRDLAFLKDFPPTIRDEVKHGLFNVFVARTYIFAGCSQGFMKQLVGRLEDKAQWGLLAADRHCISA